jgi:hypothetical protein
MDSNLETKLLLTDGIALEGVINPSTEAGVTEDEEEDTRLTISMTLLEASECLDNLKTL